MGLFWAPSAYSLQEVRGEARTHTRGRSRGVQPADGRLARVQPLSLQQTFKKGQKTTKKALTLMRVNMPATTGVDAEVPDPTYTCPPTVMAVVRRLKKSDKKREKKEKRHEKSGQDESD